MMLSKWAASRLSFGSWILVAAAGAVTTLQCGGAESTPLGDPLATQENATGGGTKPVNRPAESSNLEASITKVNLSGCESWEPSQPKDRQSSSVATVVFGKDFGNKDPVPECDIDIEFSVPANYEFSPKVFYHLYGLSRFNRVYSFTAVDDNANAQSFNNQIPNGGDVTALCGDDSAECAKCARNHPNTPDCALIREPLNGLWSRTCEKGKEGFAILHIRLEGEPSNDGNSVFKLDSLDIATSRLDRDVDNMGTAGWRTCDGSPLPPISSENGCSYTRGINCPTGQICVAPANETRNGTCMKPSDITAKSGLTLHEDCNTSVYHWNCAEGLVCTGERDDRLGTCETKSRAGAAAESSEDKGQDQAPAGAQASDSPTGESQPGSSGASGTPSNRPDIPANGAGDSDLGTSDDDNVNSGGTGGATRGDSPDDGTGGSVSGNAKGHSKGVRQPGLEGDTPGQQ